MPINSGGSRISRGEGIIRKGGGANLLFWPFFWQNLHENEKKNGPRRGKGVRAQ